MFIGRERELQELNRLFESDRFEFAVIYGRRRVGKTALITQFIRDKDAIYFMGVESSSKQNLENLSKSIIEYSSGIEADTSFLSFQAAGQPDAQIHRSAASPPRWKSQSRRA